MEIALDLRDQELFSSMIELQIKNLAVSKALASLYCDKMSATQEEADKLYQSFIEEANANGKEIMEDLFKRRGHIDLDNIIKP